MKYIRKRQLDEFKFGLPDKNIEKRQIDAKTVLKDNEDFSIKCISESTDKFLLKNYDHKFIDDHYNNSQFYIIGYNDMKIGGSEEVNTYIPSIDVSFGKGSSIDVHLKIVENSGYKKNRGKAFVSFEYTDDLDHLNKLAESLETTLSSEYEIGVKVKYQQYSFYGEGDDTRSDEDIDDYEKKSRENADLFQLQLISLGQVPKISSSEDTNTLSALKPVAFGRKANGEGSIDYWRVDYDNGYTYRQLLDFLTKRVTNIANDRLVAYYDGDNEYAGLNINDLKRSVGTGISDMYSIRFEGVALVNMKNVTDLSWVKNLCKVPDPYAVYTFKEIQEEIEKGDEVNDDMYFVKATHGKVCSDVINALKKGNGDLISNFSDTLVYYINSNRVYARLYRDKMIEL